MKHSWQEDYAKKSRKYTLEELLDELLSVAWSMENPIRLSDYNDKNWQIAFLRKEILARYKNK